MKIKEITDFLESLAPLSSQENYDNCGLIVGDENEACSSALITLDCIETTVDEAISKGCNLIIAHHPIIFSGLKKINGKNYIERTVIKAIKNGIAIYAIHTNLDNYQFGVNYEIANRLDLINVSILSPKQDNLIKLSCFVPKDYEKAVLEAMHSNGAGEIGNYSNCSFITSGSGSFMPNDSAIPFDGVRNELNTVDESKIEVLITSHQLNNVVNAMKKAHPYEEVAFDLIPILNENQSEGAGMIGELKKEMNTVDFLRKLKQDFNCEVIRHTDIHTDKVKKIAFCGGAGSFLLNTAKIKSADVFISGDFKYHEFFDAENRIIIADIGHFESEQFTSNRIERILKKKFTKFALHLTELNTNPINYF